MLGDDTMSATPRLLVIMAALLLTLSSLESKEWVTEHDGIADLAHCRSGPRTCVL